MKSSKPFYILSGLESSIFTNQQSGTFEQSLISQKNTLQRKSFSKTFCSLV